MDESQWFKHKLLNTIQSILLVVAMTITLGLLGWLIGGGLMAFYAIALVVFIYFFNPVLSPYLILKMYRTRQIMPYQAPNLYAVLQIIAKRADLPAVPKLFYLPSEVMNAFAVGTPENSAIALSDGLLRRLSLREIAAVLAHELSHVSHEDVHIMGFADITSRVTHFLSLIGKILLVLNLPLLLFFDIYLISWAAILILILAPIATDLLQMALSRTREYNADLGSAQLLGDPEALASALIKMERYQGRMLEQILWPERYSPEPSLLRTHPPTKARVERLLALREHYYPEEGISKRLPSQLDAPLFLLVARAPLRPRWHVSGIWF